jgi:uncharacterized membrane protein
MITKLSIIVLLCFIIAFFWILTNTLSRPIFNKVMNMWEDDARGRSVATLFIGLMLILAYTIGYISANL